MKNMLYIIYYGSGSAKAKGYGSYGTGSESTTLAGGGVGLSAAGIPQPRQYRPGRCAAPVPPLPRQGRFWQ